MISKNSDSALPAGASLRGHERCAPAETERRRGVAFVLFIFAIAFPAELRSGELTFFLLPQEYWLAAKAGAPETQNRILQEGEALLYRSGTYHPEIVAPANVPIPIPRGSWTWILQAEGYVSVAAGATTVPDASDERSSFSKTILWPVVPACHATIDPSARWAGVSRLDVVAIDHGAVYPLLPKDMPDIWIPAGRYIAYSVGPQGLIAISPVRTCRQFEEVSVTPPETPDRGFQDFMFNIAFRDDSESNSKSFTAFLREASFRSDSAVEIPDSAVWAVGAVSLFFLKVPAEENLQLTIRQDSYQTIHRAVESIGGAARELNIKLVPRQDLVFEVDYTPQQEHRVQEIVPYHCGYVRSGGGLESCKRLETELRLRPGLNEYRLPNLDWGQYVLHAVIDDFELEGMGRGLGAHYRPYLEPGDKPLPPPERLNLHELHVFGNILLDEEPVEGYVTLRHGHFGTLIFETDEDLLYHLYYFAVDPSVYDLTLPERESQREVEDLPPGMPNGYVVSACAKADAFCRQFSSHSKLRGEGRLDLDLGSSRSLRVEVVDAEDQEPIEGALIFTDGPSKALVFEEGDITWTEPPGEEGTVAFSDRDGVARFRALESGGQIVRIKKVGYEISHHPIRIPERGATDLRAELQREDKNRKAALKLRFTGGEPVAGAFLLPVLDSGERDVPCYAVTDRTGQASFRAGCPGDGQLVVLHSKARITSIPTSTVHAQQQIDLEYATVRPLVLRIKNQEGTPLRGLPVELQYSTFMINSSDLVLGSAAGTVLFYLTDEYGEMRLRGVDPNGAEVPTLVIGETSVPLLGYRDGETVEVTIP